MEVYKDTLAFYEESHNHNSVQRVQHFLLGGQMVGFPDIHGLTVHQQTNIDELWIPQGGTSNLGGI